MTRINAGLAVETLCDQHLLAETRELIRIPNCVAKGKYNLKGQPKEFTLGTNHVKFFYDKLKYLHNRYIELYNECIARGFNVQDYSSAFENLPKELYNDYIPTTSAIQLLNQRIQERLSTMKNVRYTKNISQKPCTIQN